MERMESQQVRGENKGDERENVGGKLMEAKQAGKERDTRGSHKDTER